MSEKSKRKKKHQRKDTTSAISTRWIKPSEQDNFLSLARNLAHPDFQSGMQPDGSVIEI